MEKICKKCGTELEFKQCFLTEGYQLTILNKIFNSDEYQKKSNAEIIQEIKDNSKMIYEAKPCIECGLREKLIKNGIPNDYLTKRFGNYVLSENEVEKKSQQKKLDWFNYLIENWQTCKNETINKIISIYGNTGTGKGHLTTAFIYELIKKYDISFKFRKFNDILVDIRNTFDDKTDLNEHKIIQSYRNADLVIIDEIGMTEKESAWSFSILYAIVDYRFENNKKTILISNLPQSEIIPYLKQHYQRLYSRVMCTDNIVLQFNWSDYRTGELK